MGNIVRSPLLRILRFILPGLAAIYVTACAVSSNPSSEVLIQTGTPTFGGQLLVTYYTVATGSYALSGQCDPTSYGLQWSYDDSTWTTLAGGCVSGTFGLSVPVAAPEDVFVRATTKKGWTAACEAMIKFAPPPTAVGFQMVTAGSSYNFGNSVIPFTMSGVSDGKLQTSASVQMDSHITGVYYGP